MSYSAINTYATVDQLKSRITRGGHVWGGDVDDADGHVETGSAEATYAEDAIEYANVKVDEALAPHVDVTPRPANDWCKDRAIDLAAARYFSLGGRAIPLPFKEAADDAQDRLDQVRENLLTIPGLDYSQPLASGRRALPFRMLNPLKRKGCC